MIKYALFLDFIFVIASFGVTLFGCLFLYLKTKKNLRKQEKDFVQHIEELPSEQRTQILKSSRITSLILKYVK